MMQKNSKIFIAGHCGLVGSAIVRKLEKEGYTNLILRTRAELDLLDATQVQTFFEQEQPEYVFLAAAKVGGILANDTYPAEFIHENITIQNNIIHQSYIHKVSKLLFLGSSCIYPKMAPQPIKEEYLLSGYLEPTNQAYAIAKIAGIVQCQAYNKQHGTNFISLMPTNLYGEHDNFDATSSHVIPALIGKFHAAKKEGGKEVVLWGTGTARREFLHVNDLAAAALFLMENHNDSEIINIGTGVDITIKELAEKIQKTVGFDGKIVWDSSKPDGTPRKLLDVEKLRALGWTHTIPLDKGLKDTYAWYTTHHE